MSIVMPYGVYAYIFTEGGGEIRILSAKNTSLLPKILARTEQKLRIYKVTIVGVRKDVMEVWGG